MIYPNITFFPMKDDNNFLSWSMNRPILKFVVNVSVVHVCTCGY